MTKHRLKSHYRLPLYRDVKELEFAPITFMDSAAFQDIQIHFQKKLDTRRRINQVSLLKKGETTYMFGRMGYGKNSTMLTLGTVIGETELFLKTES